jgi:hypothetical protein
MGSFEVEFRPLPHLVAKFIPFRHIAFDLGVSRKFIGVITEVDRSDEHKIVLRGPGAEWWLGEDDKTGPIRNPKTYTAQRSDQIMADLLLRNDGSRALNPGTMNLGNSVPTFSISYETLRRAMQRLVVMTRTEYRINTDFTFDWAGNANLFQTRNLVLSEAAGTASKVQYSPTTYGAVSKVIALGNGSGDRIIAQSSTASVDASWKDWNNAAYQRDKLVDVPSAGDAGQASAIASEVVLTRSTPDIEAKVTLGRLALMNQFDIGDTVYVHRDRVLEDTTQAIAYEGEIYPAVPLRVAEFDVSAGPEWSIILRSPDGTEEDLSDLVLKDQASKVDVRLVSNPEAFFAPLENTGSSSTDIRRNAQTLPTNSVDSTAIAIGAVSAQDIAAHAINGPNVSFGNFDNIYDDPGFELGTGSQIYTGFARTLDVTNARNGSYCAKAVGDGSTTMSVRQGTYVEARAGDQFYVECFVKKAAGTTGTCTLYLEWLDASGSQISRLAVQSTSGSTTYSQLSGASTPPNAAPAGTAYVRVAVEVTPFTGTWYVDDVYLHKQEISAYIADAAIITAKIADAQITTAKIVDLAVTNAKISSLQADKITVGNLLATISITTGLLQTAASGSRVQMSSSGIDLYTADNSGSMVATECVRWRNASGGALFAGIYAFFSTSSTRQDLISNVQRTTNNTHQNNVYSQILDTTGTVIVCEQHLRCPPDDGSTRDYMWYVHGQYGGRSIATTDGISGSSEMNFPGVGWCQTYLTGSVRLTGSGLIYENGFTWDTQSVAAGNSVTSTITYSTGFSNNLPVPDVLHSHEDDANNPSWSVFCDTRTRTGCTSKAKNIGSATGSTTVVGIPLVT